MPSVIDAPAVLGLLLVIFSGLRDLGSFISTEAYWKTKGVVVSVEQLTRELDPVTPADVNKPIAELDADDPAVRQSAADKILAIGPAALPALEETIANGSPEASARAQRLCVQIRAAFKPVFIRRLMAIRTLGEKKDAGALPVLRRLLDSKEMFEADYARSAIAAIEGKPYQPRAVSDAERAADVALLPARLDAILQAAPSIDGSFSFEKLIALLPFEKSHKLKAHEDWTTKLIDTLEKTGNIRVDAITGGFYPAPPGVPGNYMVILRGQFDATAVCALLGKFTPKSEIIGGVYVFHLDADAAVLVSSNRRIVYLAREENGELGIEAMATALQTGRGDLSDNHELIGLLKSIDRTAPLWVAIHVSPGLREIGGPLGFFDDVTLVAGQSMENQGVVAKVRLTATTSDQVRVQQGVAASRTMLQNTIAEVKNEVETKPYMKPILDGEQSISIESDGGKMTISGSFADIPVLLIPALSIPDEQAAHTPAGPPRR